MRMEKLVMGWSDGIELVAGNIDTYRSEILRSIHLICDIENVEYKEDIFNKMLDSFRRSSEYFPEVFADLIYKYRANYMNTYTANFNLVLYIIKLYKLLDNKDQKLSEAKLNEAIIENGFIQFLKICTEVQVEGTYELYNTAYAEAKRKIEDFFESDSDAKVMYDDEKYFKAFIKLKEEVRSSMMSFILRNDKDHIIELPNSMKCFTVLTAIMAEVLAMTTIINKGSTGDFKNCDFYFIDITKEFNYEIIKTR